MTPENHSLHQTSISLSGNHSDQTVLCLFKTPNTLLVLGHPWLSNIIPRLTDWSMTSIWSSFFLSVSSELSHHLLTLVLTLILLNRLSSQQSLSSQWTMFYTFMGSPWPSSLTKNLSLHLECGRCSAQVLVPSWASPQVSTPRLTAKRKHKLGIGSNRPVCHFLKPVHVEHTTYLDKIYPQSVTSSFTIWSAPWLSLYLFFPALKVRFLCCLSTSRSPWDLKDYLDCSVTDQGANKEVVNCCLTPAPNLPGRRIWLY